MLGLGLMGLFAAFAIGGLFHANDNDEPDEPTPETPDTPSHGTPGDDHLSIGLNEIGNRSGWAGDDTLTAQGITRDDPHFQDISQQSPDYVLFNLFAQGPAGHPNIQNIYGNAGNDTLIANGNGVFANGGDGQDLLDFSNADQGFGVIGAGDTMLGSTQDDSVLHVLSHGGGLFQGGAEHAVAVADGNGATLDGGAGNDALMNLDGQATLIGGAGDDTLRADINSDQFQGSHADQLSWFTDNNFDVLDGGAGNDLLTLSQGDIATLGSGADHATISDSAAHADDQAAVITDFNPAEDTLRIIAGDVNGQADHDGLVGQVSTQEVDGNTHVIVAGEVVADLQGVTGLNIGLVSNPYDEIPIYTTLDGTPADSSRFDVLVQLYPRVIGD
ncbi:calcium-binding protein [Cypionkella sinensis]|uniref:Calcium-binding protein n=1 Tax=Cypionkella sinensis TaxID=1756043 RepID=A0ABV7J6Z3_9RHOB